MCGWVGGGEHNGHHALHHDAGDQFRKEQTHNAVFKLMHSGA